MRSSTNSVRPAPVLGVLDDDDLAPGLRECVNRRTATDGAGRVGIAIRIAAIQIEHQRGSGPSSGIVNRRSISPSSCSVKNGNNALISFLIGHASHLLKLLKRLHVDDVDQQVLELDRVGDMLAKLAQCCQVGRDIDLAFWRPQALLELRDQVQQATIVVAERRARVPERRANRGQDGAAVGGLSAPRPRQWHQRSTVLRPGDSHFGRRRIFPTQPLGRFQELLPLLRTNT